MNTMDRFLDSVIPEPMSGCWLWLKAITVNTGYGQLEVAGKTKKAHRLAYELFAGTIPEGHDIHHKCQLRCCANPDHLEAITRRKHLLIGGSPVAANAVKTHCKRGHEFNAVNTYVTKSGARWCKECGRMHVRNFYRKTQDKRRNK